MITHEGSKCAFDWTVQQERCFSASFLGHPNVGCGQLRDNREIVYSTLFQVLSRR